MKNYTAKEIAEMLNGIIKGDENRVISGVSSLKEANSSQVSFLGNKKYHHQLAPSKAGVVLLSKDVENEELPPDKTYIGYTVYSCWVYFSLLYHSCCISLL